MFLVGTGTQIINVLRAKGFRGNKCRDGKNIEVEV